MSQSKSRCSGCDQEHYENLPPRWWGAWQDGVYCILCCAKLGINTWVGKPRATCT